MLGTHLAAAAVPFVLGTRPRLLANLATPLALFDVLVFGVLLVGSVAALRLPLAAFGAVPPFLFGTVLLALAALRFSPRPLLIIGASIVILSAALTLAADAPTMAYPPGDGVRPPVFGTGANLIRAAMMLAITVILALVVTRGRRLLIEALEVGERAGNLARYLPRKVAEVAAREGMEALSHGREQPAAILFADIVGFTALSERLPPEAIGRLLTELRRQQRRAIEQQGGIVDKFIGDAVMGVFGVPEPDDGAARHALAAAEAMRRALEAWHASRPDAHLPAVRVGIGVHYGTVFAGAVGDASRLEFAVLGDTVNVAQRCERLTREAGADLVVTGAVLEAAGEPVGRWRRLATERVRGREGSVEMWASTAA